MRVLALDLSLHTGWAFFQDQQLSSYGLIEAKRLPEHYQQGYPFNYVAATEDFATEIVLQIQQLAPDVIVIEETSPGRETYSQKILEFCHSATIRRLTGCKVIYLRTGEWRKTVGLRMTDQDKKGNLKRNLEKAKKEARALRAQLKILGNKKANLPLVRDLKDRLNQLRLGKVTRKHLSVRMVNEMFELNLLACNHDIADAILIGASYLKGATPCDGKRPKARKGDPNEGNK